MVLLFQNLIGNAIKYNSQKTPHIKITADRTSAGWLFKVSDNGIGIPKDALTKIFEIFNRVHGRGEFPGTGIGLAICKRIVEQGGGEIWVESVSGKGSIFYFTVPDKEPQA
jgi:signal transduction histidine kinase